MKNLSNSNNNKLINEVEQGYISNKEINNLVNLYSNEKIVKIMKKINNFMTGGADVTSENNQNTNTTPNIIPDSTPSDDIPPNDNLTTVKDSVKEIIDKLKTKSDLLKEKEIELIARENEIKMKEETLKNLENDIEKLKKIKEQLNADIDGIKEIKSSTTDTINQIKLDIDKLQGGSYDSEIGILTEIFN